MRKTPVVAALRKQRAATLRRLGQLPDRVWESPCLPCWRVRDVAAHLVAIDEAMVTGRMLRAMRSCADRTEFERWNDDSLLQWSDRSPVELIEALETGGDRLPRLVARMPSAALQVPFKGGWFGRQPLLFLVYRRVLDEWVHDCDIAWATAPREDRAPVAAPPGVPDVLAAAALSSLPALALSRTQRTNGVVRLVVETGSDQRRTWSVDFARRQYGARVTARPDAVVRTDAYTLVLLAEDRCSWKRLPPERLAVEGDEVIAVDLLDLIETASPGPR